MGRFDVKDDATVSIDRRGFLRAGLTAAVLLPVAGAAFQARASEPLITEIEANTPMIQALQYVTTSAKPDQKCGNCQLYTAGEGGKGKCQLFQQGVVVEGGWCMSWAQKVQ
jgi:hypothetical protein